MSVSRSEAGIPHEPQKISRRRLFIGGGLFVGGIATSAYGSANMVGTSLERRQISEQAYEKYLPQHETRIEKAKKDLEEARRKAITLLEQNNAVLAAQVVSSSTYTQAKGVLDFEEERGNYMQKRVDEQDIFKKFLINGGIALAGTVASFIGIAMKPRIISNSEANQATNVSALSSQ